MEEQLNELNKIIDLINHNIEKISNIEYGEDFYIINHIIKSKEITHFETKQKEDIELNQIDISLSKLNYSKQKTRDSEKLSYFDKIINFYLSKRNLINNNRNIRIKEIDNLKKKREEILEDEKYFYQTKKLIINILKSFIYSINLNNTYYILANYTNYNKFTAFIDNKTEVNPRIIEFFKEINATIIYDTCISFESTLEELTNLLTTKNIEWILISSPEYQISSKKRTK